MIPEWNYNIRDIFMTKFLLATLRNILPNRHIMVKVNKTKYVSIKGTAIRDIEYFHK